MATSNQPDVSKYKQKFLETYGEMLEWIRPEHFAEYNERAPNHRSIEVFRGGLLENLLSYFNNVWDTTNTDEQLNVLDMLKADPKNDSVKKWRPTGKSAQEQVRPLIINKLKWQKRMYEKQIQYQKQQLEQAVTQVELSRKKWTDLNERREFLKNAITSELQDLKNIESQITDIEDKVTEDLQR
ncbi:uncharacterized protein LOC135704431 [Ochlerotatus camptorhynchus]|uniref:uncharacterized protein LOC135704431 n=1 Tax=Ochlerotatus camptorhynchus TaxID=644619 RepID=UPI0031DA4CC8